MGFWNSLTDLLEAVSPFSESQAEAPVADSPKKDDDAADEEEEEEEEEEEQVQDPKEKFEAECRESPKCAPAKHHYDECVERVQQAESTEEGTKEDCVEEFFHLVHCSTQCAAPKLWAALK